jgi:hypothetical protein
MFAVSSEVETTLMVLLTNKENVTTPEEHAIKQSKWLKININTITPGTRDSQRVRYSLY